MQLRSFVVAISLIAAAGCSGSHANGTAQSQQSIAGAPSEAVHSTLPVYPGAIALPMQMHRAVKACGTVAHVTIYSAKDADAATVSKWYDDRIPKGIHLTLDSQMQTQYGSSTHTVIIAPDGTGGVMVAHLQFAMPKMAGIARQMGADRTMIGVETFTPPLPPEVIALLARGSSGDPAARAAARSQIKSKCGGGFAHS